MNTEKSDKIAQQWIAADKPLKRASFARQQVFNTTPARLFPLLCPTTEYDWLPGWSCRMLHSESGYAEYNVVFVTQAFGREELWICTRFEPNRAIEYARTSQNSCAKMDISLADNGDGTVIGTWVISIAALNEKGNAEVDEVVSSGDDMEQVFDVLGHYVDTGEVQA